MKLRGAMVVVSLFAGAAFADVPGPKSVCHAPLECVGCSISDPDCKANAQDAGLLATDCTTQRGTPVNYYCPPGVEPVQACGCSSASGLLALGVLVMLARRAKKNPLRA